MCIRVRSVSADDVGLDELGRAGDGAVYMGFGGQVHDCVWLMFLEHLVNRFTVTDVHVRKRIALAVFNRLKRLEV